MPETCNLEGPDESWPNGTDVQEQFVNLEQLHQTAMSMFITEVELPI
jgi:hypothetical protein